MLTLEVERKFSRLAVKTFLHQQGHPPFHTLEHHSHKTFHDIYYDKTNFLSSKGVWIRKRDNRWQAKIRVGGDYTNSKFEELSKPAEISRYLAELTGRMRHEGECFGLQKMAAFTTMRESWVADGEFTIVQDVTDFGHTVGEVELECRFEDRAGGFEGNLERYKALKMGEMDARITAFMKRYEWAFCKGVPKGKLTAYFEKFLK